MPAYFVARFAVKDPTLLGAYSKETAPIIASFGGELLFKGGADQILTGNAPFRVLQFSSSLTRSS